MFDFENYKNNLKTRCSVFIDVLYQKGMTPSIPKLTFINKYAFWKKR